jgi:hypothetical protein
MRPIPQSLKEILARLPEGWVDDGLSCFPDRIPPFIGYDLRMAGTGHDWAYCTRCHPAGEMDEDQKRHADLMIRDWVWAMLPFGLRLTGYVIFLGLWRGGYGAFDSCGPHPHGASEEQRARPSWMPAPMPTEPRAA